MEKAGLEAGVKSWADILAYAFAEDWDSIDDDELAEAVKNDFGAIAEVVEMIDSELGSLQAFGARVLATLPELPDLIVEKLYRNAGRDSHLLAKYEAGLTLFGAGEKGSLVREIVEVAQRDNVTRYRAENALALHYDLYDHTWIEDEDTEPEA